MENLKKSNYKIEEIETRYLKKIRDTQKNQIFKGK